MRRFSLALVLLATVLVYLPGLGGGFLFDDLPNITHNPRLVLDKLDGASLWEAALSSQAGRLKRPVSMLSLALNRTFLGADPASFKGVNLAIHLLCGVLLHLFLRRLLRHFPGVKDPPLVALAVTAAWLLHPLNLSPVLYVVQRMTSLAALFTLAGLLHYLWAREKRLDHGGGLSHLLAGTVVWTTLALLSKENGALLPLFLLLVEAACFGFRDREGQRDRGILLLFSLALLLPALGLVLLFLGQPDLFLRGYGLRPFTLEERLLTQGPALLFYLRLLFLPDPRQLGLFHDDFPLATSLWQPEPLLSWLFLAFLCAVGLAYLRRRSLAALGLLWFFAGHLIESTILPLELVHEHRNYLPSLGILLAGCGWLLSPAPPAPLFRWSRGAALLLLLLFALITLQRATAWSDNTALYLLEAAHHPRSPRALFEAGRAHANLFLQGRSPAPTEALRLLEEASRLDETSSLPDTTLAVFAEKGHLPRQPQWLEGARRKLATRPLAPGGFVGLQELLECQAAKECSFTDPEVLSLLDAIQSNPRISRLEESVLTLFAGYLIEVKGELERGIPLLERSLAVATDPANAHLNLAWALLSAHRPAEARQHGETALSLDPLGRLARELDQLFKEIQAAEAATPTSSRVRFPRLEIFDAQTQKNG